MGTAFCCDRCSREKPVWTQYVEAAAAQDIEGPKRRGLRFAKYWVRWMVCLGVKTNNRFRYERLVWLDGRLVLMLLLDGRSAAGQQ